jgi:thiamine-monophosphate kinase
MPPRRPTEDELIARYFAPLAGAAALGLTDDAGCLSPSPGHDLVLTVDAVVAGIHFFPDDPPASIGRKALAVNASDLAAKGAVPVGFLLTLALPDDWTESFLKGFAQGLGDAARDFGCPLIGGDTVRSGGPLTLSVTALGEVPAGRMVRRLAAKPGDRICVTGTIGDAALGLLLRRRPGQRWAAGLTLDRRVHLIDRYLHPNPRLRAAGALRDYASAAMDVSDGLAGDLAKMLRPLGLSARVEAADVPLSPAARSVLAAEPGLIDAILTGGDDYEVLAAVPDAAVPLFLDGLAQAGLSGAAIGTVIEGTEPPCFLVEGGVRRFERASYSHF